MVPGRDLPGRGLDAPGGFAFAPSPGPRHLVMLARHLPPTINGGVYRPLALLDAAIHRDWEVTAVCISPDRMPRSRRERAPGSLSA